MFCSMAETSFYTLLREHNGMSKIQPTSLNSVDNAYLSELINNLDVKIKEQTSNQ